MFYAKVGTNILSHQDMLTNQKNQLLDNNIIAVASWEYKQDGDNVNM